MGALVAEQSISIPRQEGRFPRDDHDAGLPTIADGSATVHAAIVGEVAAAEERAAKFSYIARRHFHHDQTGMRMVVSLRGMSDVERGRLPHGDKRHQRGARQYHNFEHGRPWLDCQD
jgi:hypothetical protein